MSALFLAIPLTIFVLFVAPVWLWLHYQRQRSSGTPLNDMQRQRLQALESQAEMMADRIRTLERILDAEQTDWRNQ